MSRSYRRSNNYSCTVTGLNKGIHDDKKMNNRIFRSRAKRMLATCGDYENLSLPYKLEEVMERWSYRDDGRFYWSPRDILENSDKPWAYFRK